MKKMHICVIFALRIFLFSACNLPNAGTTENVEINLGQSQIFSENEIKEAMDVVQEKFSIFSGCDLQKLWYDEIFSSGRYDDDETNKITILSNFYVNENGGKNGLNPDFDYTDWQWHLVRNSKTSKWVVIDWGYG